MSGQPGLLWHGPHPEMPTGYATQTAMLLPRFKLLGYRVAVSATAGQPNHPGFWHGIPVYPCTTYADVGEDVVGPHYKHFRADLVITFLCTWLLSYPQTWRDLRTVHLTPVDCDPMSMADYQVIADTGGTPAAISRFGEKMMRAGVEGRAALDPLYLPHGIDTKTFAPAPDRDAIRETMGFAGKFMVGLNFMNNDRQRKNIEPALRGFAEFRRDHPDAFLAVHALNALPEGFHLQRLGRHLGIWDAMSMSPQYELVTGMIKPADLAPWYQAMDVVLDIGNEGFGLTGLEAQACGTPVIRGDWSTGPELVGPGWLVTESEPYWNEKHQATWRRARVGGVRQALEDAYAGAADRREASREFAETYDIDTVVDQYWRPVLKDLAGG